MTTLRTILCLLLWTAFDVYARQSIQIVTEDWPPFNYRLPGGKVGGIASDKVRLVMDKSRLPYNIEVYPWAKAYEMAKDGKNVMIYSIIRNHEREKLFKWICPLTQPVTLFYFALAIRKDIILNSSENLKHYSLGITPSEFSQYHLKSPQAPHNASVKLSADSRTNLNRLLRGEVDLIIEAVPSIKLRLERMGQDYSVVRPMIEITTDNVAPTCMAFGLKTDDSIINKIKQSLKLINDPT